MDETSDNPGQGQASALLRTLRPAMPAVIGAAALTFLFAAVMPMFHLPEAGVLLIMGIDVFLDMGRTATNVLGNSIATAVIAKWENAYDEDDSAEIETGTAPEAV